MNLGFLHLHSRKRPEPFPSRNGYKRLLDHAMFVVAFFAPLALVPQVFSIYTTNNVQGLVLTTWLMLASINILWILYGASHKTTPVVVANVFFLLLNASGAVGILL